MGIPRQIGWSQEEILLWYVLKQLEQLTGVVAFISSGGGGGSTNLGYIASPGGGTVTNSTGTPANIPLVTSVNAGLMSPADFTKLGTLTVVPDATTLVKGIVKLDGDLGGTADLPTVPGLASKLTAVTAGTNINVDNTIPTAPVISAIPSTSAGVFDRVYFTGQVATGPPVGAVPVYDTLRNGKGSVALVTLTSASLASGAKAWIPNDLIGPPQVTAGSLPIGNYSSFLTATTSSSTGTKRIQIEVFLCTSNGTIIPSVGPPSADPNAFYTGKNTVVILDSGFLSLVTGNNTQAGLSGYLASVVPVAIGQRFRYHISVQRNVSAGNQTTSFLIGNTANSYIEAPIPITTTTVINASTVPGATATDALNNLYASTASINGTQNYIPKYGVTGLVNSQIFESGGRILIGTITDNTVDKLQVNGSGIFNSKISLNGIQPHLVIATPSLTDWKIGMLQTSDTRLFFRANDAVNALVIWAETGKAVFSDTVIIGNNPDNGIDKLQVNGSISATEGFNGAINRHSDSTIIDLNIVTTDNGVLRFDPYRGDALNTPPSSNINLANGVLSMFIDYAGTYGKQIAFGDTDDLFIRKVSESVYYPWFKVWTSNSVIKLRNYTVGTLPAGTAGDTAYVTDALTPTYHGVAVGGGTVGCQVTHNGTNWIT